MVTAPTVLLADDDPGVRTLLERALTRAEMRVVSVGNGMDALAALDLEPFDAALLDVSMPVLGGLELLGEIRRRRPELGVVLMTGLGTIDTAVRAMKEGALDFLQKPFEGTRVVIDALQRAIAPRASERVAVGTAQMLGNSPPIERLRREIGQVAASAVTVLVVGESGVGKELVAREIHAASGRTGPFVAVNVAAVPEQLFDAELHGHVKGAFSGAVSDRKGLFEHANGGTLFLDEVGELALPLQGKLLRLLQEGVVRPVGSTLEQPFDVRIVAATNVDLAQAVRAKSFREDLFYRLDVLRVSVPPLRERGADVQLLADAFVQRAAQRHGRTTRGLSEGARARLASYTWPGNIRELENVVTRAVVLSGSESIEERDLALPITEASPAMDLLTTLPFTDARERAVESFERQYVQALLRRTEGNVSEAARRAGMDRANFRRVMRRLGLAGD